MGRKTNSSQRGGAATEWGGSDFLDTSPAALRQLSPKQQCKGGAAAWEVDNPAAGTSGGGGGGGGDVNSRQQRFSLPLADKQQAVDGGGNASNEDTQEGAGDAPSATKVCAVARTVPLRRHDGCPHMYTPLSPASLPAPPTPPTLCSWQASRGGASPCAAPQQQAAS